MKFEINEGKTDRIIRAVIVVILFTVAFFFSQGALKIFCLIFGIMMTITTTIGWCPLYILFGFDTCGKKEKTNDLL
jgi:hypothetical protein